MVKKYKVIGKLVPLFGEFYTFLSVGAGVKRKKMVCADRKRERSKT